MSAGSGAIPPPTYRPHTRWWWPGNAVTKEGIDWQLEQMKEKGIGGVQIASFLKIYDKGNIEFGSPEFFEIVAYTVNKARELGMEVTPPLGPGWNHGHAWVPEEDRAKAMVISEQVVKDGQAGAFKLTLPEEPAYAKLNKKKLEAVVAVKLGENGTPDPSQRVDLSNSVKFAIFPLHLQLDRSSKHTTEEIAIAEREHSRPPRPRAVIT